MIADLIVLFFLFSGVLYLEAFMPFLAVFQLLVIFVGIISAFILVYAQISEKKWAFPFAAIFYSFALADLLILAFLTRHFLAFLVISFFATIGLVRAVFKIEEEVPEQPLDTYDTYATCEEEPTQVEAVPIIVDMKKEKTVKKKPKKKKK